MTIKELIAYHSAEFLASASRLAVMLTSDEPCDEIIDAEQERMEARLNAAKVIYFAESVACEELAARKEST